MNNTTHCREVQDVFSTMNHMFFPNLYDWVPETQRSGSSLREEFPKRRHRTKASVYDFPPCRMPTLPPCGCERSASKKLTSNNECWGCWRVSNWRSLNKSHRGRLLILMTHPHHAVRHTSLPAHTHPRLPSPRCGNAPLLFLPFCPPRWTHPKPPQDEQNKLSWKLPVHISPP